MRLFLATCVFILSLTAPAFSQVVGGDVVVQVMSSYSYGVSSSYMDQHGNLMVFDTIYTLSRIPVPILPPIAGTSGPTTGIAVPARQMVAPKTRITVVPSGGGQPVSREYEGSVQVIGVGKSAVYAVFYGSSILSGLFLPSPRKLIAIDAGPAGLLLPADASGFLSADLTPAGEVKLIQGNATSSDTIFCVDPASNPIMILNAPTLMPVARVARTIRFDGVRFSSTDVTLPQ